ncbi:hypothetical protein PSM7751_02269 [Pseudooceanicola marinus]|uniref:Uncharacterized protein n=1 Tax=Pseudooceanicola marinus TaxID=396013 RepID=A0A1X6ZDI4_9RHOB|nr:hypothetical protein [Pseudooceanicola marinus]PJE28322.1 hypothetical protein CVM50_15380 [Pseudooceanicola marinus]SLN47827.1 hypothetical protein PSM7751_02269 [Pseudooceanicola marinus]
MRTLLLISPLLWAGTALAEPVIFQPAPDSTRSYSLSVGDEARPLAYDALYGRYLDTYLDVTATEDGVHTIPTRVELREDDQYASSSSPGQWSDALTALQRAGYDTVISGDDTARTVTSAAPDVEQGAGDKAAQLHAALSDPFASPAFPITVQAEEGWSTTLPELGSYEDVEVRVTAVTEDEVRVAFTGGTGPDTPPDADDPRPWRTRGHRIAGLAVLDRAEGWVIRQVVTRETTLTLNGQKLPSRRTTVLTPLTDGEESFAPEGSRWPRDIEKVMAPTDLPPATEDQMFGDEATFEFYGAPALLAIPAEMESFIQAGRMTFNDLRLFDEAGEPVDLRTHIGTVYAQPDFGYPDSLRSAALVTPNVIGPVMLDQMSRMTAEVAWYPSTTQVIEMTADEDGRASVDSNGLRAQLHPGDRPGTYILRYSGQKDDLITWSVPEEISGQAALYAHDRGPDWLSPAESQVRMFAAEHPEGQTLVLDTETAPQAIHLRLARPAEQPQVRREITFAPREYGR